MNNRVLITGINGSGGSYLAEFLVSEHPEVEVHGLSRWHSTTSSDNLSAIRHHITMHECDLLDLASTIRVLREVNPKIIFHLASHANVRVCFEIPLAVLNNNITSTANLLEAIRMVCPETLLHHCSTSEVYGNPLNFPMTEDHPLKPVNPYAVSKLTQEALVHAYHKSWGIRTVITRMFAYINPRRRDLFATSFAYQLVEIERGKRDVLRYGNLDSIRNIIDVRDAMRAYWVACEKCQDGEIYNVGGKVILTVGQFLDTLLLHAKVPIIKALDKNLLRPVDVTKQVPDTTKFDTITGFLPEYTLDESIEFLLDYCRKEVK